MVIGVLITSLLYAVYSTAIRVKEAQQARQVGPHRTADILHRMSGDLRRLWLPKDDDAGLLLLEPSPAADHPPRLSFVIASPDPIEPDLQWTDAVAVRYEAESVHGSLELIRVAHPLAGPGSTTDPVTNRLAVIESLSVEIFDGTEWVESYDSSEAENPPAAVRLVLDLPGGERPSPPMTTEVLIPFGQKVTGTLQRSSSATPP